MDDLPAQMPGVMSMELMRERRNSEDTSAESDEHVSSMRR